MTKKRPNVGWHLLVVLLLMTSCASVQRFFLEPDVKAFMVSVEKLVLKSPESTVYFLGSTKQFSDIRKAYPRLNLKHEASHLKSDDNLFEVALKLKLEDAFILNTNDFHKSTVSELKPIYEIQHEQGPWTLFQNRKYKDRNLLVTKRLRDFIYHSRDRYKIYLKDMLGEGQGHFDSDPRYLPTDMNCTTWIQSALAQSYALGGVYLPKLMNHLRYYYGEIGFSTRSHFLDRWIYLSPNPFRKISTSECTNTKTRTLKLDFNKFKKAKGYECPLFQEEQNEFTVEYMSQKEVFECAQNLEQGVYVLFPISSKAYMRKYGKHTGPMGLVHGLFLDIREGKKRTEHIFHASILSGNVEAESLKSYLFSKRGGYYDGFTIWELDPNWNPLQDKPTPDQLKEIQALQACEKKLLN